MSCHASCLEMHHVLSCTDRPAWAVACHCEHMDRASNGRICQNNSALLQVKTCVCHAVSDCGVTSHTAHVIVQVAGGKFSPSVANMVVCKHLHCMMYML